MNVLKDLVNDPELMFSKEAKDFLAKKPPTDMKKYWEGFWKGKGPKIFSPFLMLGLATCFQVNFHVWTVRIIFLFLTFQDEGNYNCGVGSQGRNAYS